MTTDTATELITVTRTVDATPDAVWAAVSDLRAMGERSPQCRRMIVLGGSPGVGTTTVNINRRGIVHWPTTSKITRWTPGKILEWRVPVNGSHWRYELTDNGDGTTELTESRIVDGGTSLVSRAMVAGLLGGNTTFESELRTGMEDTLVAVAATAERSG